MIALLTMLGVRGLVKEVVELTGIRHLDLRSLFDFKCQLPSDGVQTLRHVM
jgi:hypothetical protein